MVNSRRVKDKSTSLLFMNREDIDGRPISGANRTRRLFVQCHHRHERLLEQQTIVDAYLGECRFVLLDSFRERIEMYISGFRICSSIIPKAVDIPEASEQMRMIWKSKKWDCYKAWRRFM